MNSKNPMLQQLQLSHPTTWPNKPNLPKQQQLRYIEKKIQKKIYTILRTHPLGYKQKKKKIYNFLLLYINPLSTSIAVWNFIIIFVAYFLCFQISLTLAFGPQFWSNQIQQTVYRFIYICLLIMLIFDMFMNFVKGYYGFGSGKVIDDKILIVRKYIKTYFFPDLICIIILIIPIFKNEYILNFLQLVPLFLLFVKKFKCQADIVYVLTYRKILRIVFILGLLGCDYFIFGNFGACIFLGLDLLLWRLQFFGNNPQYYWLSNNTSYGIDIMNGPWFVQYIYAQEYATGTLSTLAPGPFGKNPFQNLFVIVCMTIFMIIGSYVGQVLVQILYNNFEVRIFHQNNIQRFDNFMSLKGVSQKIKRRVHNFFQLIWQFQIKNDTQGQQKIVQKLPFSLQQDLVIQLGFSSQLRFPDHFKDFNDLKKIMAFKIKSMIVDPDATLFQPGLPYDTKGQGYIIFIKNGLAKYFFTYGQNNNKNIVSLSNSRKLIGQYEFITGLSYPFSCKLIDLSVIQKISFSDIRDIIKNYNFQEQFHVLKCRLMYTRQLNLISEYCMICDGKHRQNQCPQISIHHKIQQQIKQQNNLHKNLYKQQDRLKFKRKIYKQNKSLNYDVNLFNVLNQQNVNIVTNKIYMQYHNIKISMEENILNKQSDQVASFQGYFYQYNMFQL